MKYAWITQHGDLYPIVLMCELLAVSKAGYYDSLHRKPSSRAQRRERIHAAVRAVHAESQAIYGSFKIAREMARRDNLESACRNTVARAMRDMGLASHVAKAFRPTTTKSDPTKQAAPNVLDRDFAAERPNQKWVTDITYLPTLDEQYLTTPFYGSRRMAVLLGANRKRIRRLMRTMGIEAIYPKRRTTWPGSGHKIYPYLLRNVEVLRPDQVWSTDITYVPLRHGFLYLVAIMDWYSRHVLSWRLSNTLDGGFCLEALDESLSVATPEIFNSDQGCQFTAAAFTSRLEARGIAVSMDGRGRAIDNVFIERLWRSVKYEEVYLRDYADGWEAEEQLAAYFRFYSHERIHQALGYRTPAAVYREGR